MQFIRNINSTLISNMFPTTLSFPKQLFNYLHKSASFCSNVQLNPFHATPLTVTFKNSNRSDKILHYYITTTI